MQTPNMLEIEHVTIGLPFTYKGETHFIPLEGREDPDCKVVYAKREKYPKGKYVAIPWGEKVEVQY